VTDSTSARPSTVHVLTVHGVGGHDHLSNLLRTYQAFRANLLSVEAPILGEDRIPAWALTGFDEGGSPPSLTLTSRNPPKPGGVGAVRLYEVNYSGFAGVIRRNHRIDLTDLFLGLDLAVSAARQRPSQAASGAGQTTAEMGRCLQRVAGILSAGTVPIIGLPSLVFRNYIGTFVGAFTRFFEDIATFAIDKNGEQLISAHLDRTIATIGASMQQGDQFVIAAHSLGSVVAHNYVVRNRASGPGRVPDTVVTFGSPIGLLSWIWLFLDFEDMDFTRRVNGDHYFCWNPVSNGQGDRSPLSWINVLNCGDPIATAFPTATIDLSRQPDDIARGLVGDGVMHRFFGPARISAVGASHGEYLNDKVGFLRVLLRAIGLASGPAEDVEGARTAAEHWAATDSVLRRTQRLLIAVALVAVTLYCWRVATMAGAARAWIVAVVFVWPAATIGVLTFFQRLMLGGPTKRITRALIGQLRWGDITSFPYRLRQALASPFGWGADLDPMAPSPGYLTRLGVNVLSFIPTLVLMAIPLAAASFLTSPRLAAGALWRTAFSLNGLVVLALFMTYVMACAAHEIVRTWRRIVRVATG